MKLDQIMEMAYPQKIARDIIVGMARPINQHLIKLVDFDFPPQLRDHFRRELRNWLDEIQRIRLKLTTRTGSFKFYFDPMFDYPFGGIEIRNMSALMDFISSDYDEIRPTKSPEDLVAWLRNFHTELGTTPS
jgi:hypothetical protein